MTHTLMRGANTLRGALATHLSETMPRLINRARIDWEKEDWQLPYPQVYDSYDPLGARVFPTIGSIVQTTNGWRRLDINKYGENQYLAKYSVQAFIWVLTPTRADGTIPEQPYDETMSCRDDLLGIMLSAILQKPSLGKPNQIAVDENTIRVDYHEPLKVSEQSGKWHVGGTINFDAGVVEETFLLEVGTANTISVNVDKTPPVME